MLAPFLIVISLALITNMSAQIPILVVTLRSVYLWVIAKQLTMC